MCAQFIIKGHIEKALRQAGIHWDWPMDWPLTSTMTSTAANEEFDQLVVPHKNLTPVATQNDIRRMSFGLIPHWSKEKSIRFATHNARLRSEDKKTLIFNKATWREPFSKKHCVVPITQFIEPIYTGKWAGNMVRFGDKLENILFAAGVWDQWIDQSTGEIVESFALITTDPPPFVRQIGHDRCPLFLEDKSIAHWLSHEIKNPEEWVNFLDNQNKSIDFEVSMHRPMASGWKKRIPK